MNTIEAYAEGFGPPSSPPIIILLAANTTKAMHDAIRKIMTENPSYPAGVTYFCGGSMPAL